MNNLPKNLGLRRRLAYSESIRQRHAQLYRPHNNEELIPLLNSLLQAQSLTHNLTNRRYYINGDSDQSLDTYEERIAYEEIHAVKIGLINENLLKNTKITLHTNNINNTICIICQHDIINNEIIRTLNCNHLYHIDCIDFWLTLNKTCPLCKIEI